MRHRRTPRLVVFFPRRLVPRKRHVFIQKSNHAVQLPNHTINTHPDRKPKSIVQSNSNTHGQSDGQRNSFRYRKHIADTDCLTQSEPDNITFAQPNGFPNSDTHAHPRLRRIGSGLRHPAWKRGVLRRAFMPTFRIIRHVLQTNRHADANSQRKSVTNPVGNSNTHTEPIAYHIRISFNKSDA